MIGAAITFIVLYGLMWFFEPRGNKLDAFDVGAVTVVPILAYALTLLLRLVIPDMAVVRLIALVVFIAVTFVLLFRFLKVSILRSAGYTAAALAVNVGVNLLFRI